MSSSPYLEPRNPLEAEQLEDFDALILLTQRFTQDSIHSNGCSASSSPVSASAGYDTVDVQACTQAGIALVITPDGVRRPGRGFDHHICWKRWLAGSWSRTG